MNNYGNSCSGGVPDCGTRFPGMKAKALRPVCPLNLPATLRVSRISIAVSSDLDKIETGRLTAMFVASIQPEIAYERVDGLAHGSYSVHMVTPAGPGHSHPTSQNAKDHASGHAAHRHGQGHGHGHGHDHEHSHAANTALLGFAFVLTATFMVVEFAGGFLAQSLALIADAGHMLTDAAALALAWAAGRIAARPADVRRSFGYQRLRVLAAFVNGCALLFIVAWIAFEALHRLMTPLPVKAVAMLWIGSIGLLVNIVVFAMLRRGDAHDMNISAATLHVLGDLLGSVAAIIAATVILLTGWLAIDPLLSLVVCVLIVRSALALVRRSAHILMEGSPDWLDVPEVRRTLVERIPAIRDVHHVHAWLVGPQEALLTMHAVVAADANFSAVVKEAHLVLAERFGITHATVQVEAEVCSDHAGRPIPCK